jgi:thioredoxin reductase (NADPH)
VLVAVDEDAGVMRDVERELRDRYARHYRVVCMRSPREVLARLEELAAEGEQVALVLAGQRLSGMTEASCWIRRVTCTRTRSAGC